MSTPAKEMSSTTSPEASTSTTERDTHVGIKLETKSDSKSDTTQSDVKPNMSTEGVNRFAISRDNFILLNVPGGKPKYNSSQSKRVPQKIKEGQHCFYYAMKVAAMMEDDYLKKRSEKERRIISEKLRKPKTALDIKVDTLLKWLDALFGLFDKNTPKEQVVDFLKNIVKRMNPFEKQNKFLPHAVEDPKKLLEDILTFLDNFLKSREKDIFEFIRKEKISESIKIFTSALTALGYNPEAEVEKLRKVKNSKLLPMHQYNSDFKSMSPNSQFSFLGEVAQAVISKIFGMSHTRWNPQAGIKVLFNLIKQNKNPIVIEGLFGNAFYEQPAFLRDDTKENYVIYGWKPNTHKIFKTNHSNTAGNSTTLHFPSGQIIRTHTISVIGVEIKNENSDEGYVYFIDPNDESKPNEKRRIYVISYKQFCAIALDSDISLGLRKDHFMQNTNNPQLTKTLIAALETELQYGWQKSASVSGRP